MLQKTKPLFRKTFLLPSLYYPGRISYCPPFKLFICMKNNTFTGVFWMFEVPWKENFPKAYGQTSFSPPLWFCASTVRQGHSILCCGAQICLGGFPSLLLTNPCKSTILWGKVILCLETVYMAFIVLWLSKDMCFWCNLKKWRKDEQEGAWLSQESVWLLNLRLLSLSPMLGYLSQ